MRKGISRSLEERKVWELNDALGASLDLRTMLKDAFPLLLPLVGADYGALAVSQPERADELEWIDQNLPPAFLASYKEMVPHDFVLRSVLAKVRVVVRDCEMIERRAFERNMMYQRAREVGSPIEQVMAVMLHAGEGFQSGLALYRHQRRPFSEREERMLERLTGPIAIAVRGCRLFAEAKRRDTPVEGAPNPSTLLIKWERLTEREREVVSRVRLGMDNKSIAEDLCCALNTVKKHMRNIFDKLGVDDRKRLIYLAAHSRDRTR
jgi:DNA-binding CsgD family transcriptional regulator